MYLVTGGAGFIGSNIVDELVRRGERVRVFDNFSTGSIDNLAAVRDRIDIVEGDLRDMAALRRAVQGVSYITHQAALRSVPRSVDDPMSTDDVNTHGTLQLLVAAREAKVKRLVYASSSSAYGDSPLLPKVEDQTPAPISPYAVSKLAAEHYCRTFSHLYGLETVSLRYFNVFGPKQSPESKYAAVVPLFIRAALDDEPLIVHGDGEQSRDFTYVENVVAATISAAGAAGASGRVFNVAGGAPASVNHVADTIGEILGRPVEKVFGRPRQGDIRDSWADLTAAREALGYEPAISLEEGLRRTAEALLT